MAAYGKGVYFARDAIYSMDTLYAKISRDGYQYLLYCKVICGEWTKGKHDMQTPPKKPGVKPVQKFESLRGGTCNHRGVPEIVVTTNDGQAYPMLMLRVSRKS